MEKTYLTPEGKKQLEEKLTFYKTVKRPEVISKIGTAREFGDLSENAEYDAAKEEQAITESEILEMEVILRNCEIINKKALNTDIVSIGTRVTVFDEEFDEDVEYQITGSTESDPLKGLISNNSPVGKALLGHKVGDVVNVSTPGGITRYRVKAIRA